MTNQMWMATVRQSGKLYPVNVGSKDDVIMDAMMCTRIAVSRANRETVQLFFSKSYQSALTKTRALFDLTENPPQELLAAHEEVFVSIGSGL